MAERRELTPEEDEEQANAMNEFHGGAQTLATQFGWTLEELQQDLSQIDLEE
jgi:hypothetical protein